MPTTEHEAIGDLFREDPQLAPRLLKTVFGRDIPGYAHVRVGDSALNQTMSVEFRADVVLDLEDDKQIPVLSIIVEVQRDVDVRKEKTWPVYTTVQRARRGCPAIVLVVATNRAVADWAARPIDVGLGLTTMCPLVLGPGMVPVITDVAIAQHDPALALLSALCHDDGQHGREVVLAVGRAFAEPVGLSKKVANWMLLMVYNHVREPLKRALEAMLMEVKLGKYTVEVPPFFQPYVEQGLSQGLSQGIGQGELKHARRALLRWVSRAGIVLTDEQQKRIETCADLSMLDRWADNAVNAKSADEVFGE